MDKFFFFFPLFLQGIALLFDEFYFHYQRGLPLWERIGHPIDTFGVTLVGLFGFFFPYTASNLKIFLGLSAFSCLLVTKDEWIHKHYSPASENWLHALLFINHPLLLWSFAAAWKKQQTSMILFFIFSTFAFGLYQAIYWNFFRKERKIYEKKGE